MRNLVVLELDERVTYIRGGQKPLGSRALGSA
jgi:D-aminopeptidase